MFVGQSALEVGGYGTVQRNKGKLSKIVSASMSDVRPPHLAISMPEDFRRVSAIIDVDIVPATQRRVRLMKSGVDANKPLGFYIRDGTSIRVTPTGVEKVSYYSYCNARLFLLPQLKCFKGQILIEYADIPIIVVLL